ncbi:MAG: hypothetical protein JW770_05135 [Actinobacteria bacterium]|nr:hypothetical protein [Actinomycetota bacterium]
MKIYNLDSLDFFEEDIKNQSNRKLLNGSLSTGSISHAYLFTGNSMDLLYNLALAFSASINCPGGGCGTCSICKATFKGVYPDMIVVEPEGSILIKEEIMKLQNFMSLTSSGPGKKICIIKEAELINPAASNRLLKTLEDPPDEDSVFILLAEDISMMLPTVVSRCLVYSWNFKISQDMTGGEDFSILEKILDAGIKSIIEKRGKPGSVGVDLTIRILEIIKKMEAGVKSSLDREVDRIKESSYEQPDIKKYVDTIKSKNIRKMAKFRKLGMGKVFDIISAWLEDILAVGLGATEESLNFKHNWFFINKMVKNVKIEKIFHILGNVERNRSNLHYSVNPEIALDSIFLQIQYMIWINR